ncbi:hypothetical protein Tco_1370545 [Tanacetum coccineum]
MSTGKCDEKSRIHCYTQLIWASDEEPEAPPSPDYVPGPEHPPSPNYVPGPEEPEQAPLSLDYVPEPEYPEYLAPSDDEVPVEDQPLPADASPAALSPGYIADSDPEEDPEEDPAAYPIDRRDDDDDESSDDDDDDDNDEDQEASEDDDEEEEHPAPADSSVVPIDDHVPAAKDTEAFKTDESAPTPVPSPRRRTARMSVRPQTPMLAATETLIVAIAAALPSSPPPSLLTPLSSPLPQIPSPPLPPIHTSPTYAEAPLGYRAAVIRLRDASPLTHHPSEIPSPPMLLPSTSHKDNLPEVEESSAATAARQLGLNVATMDANPKRPMYREVGYGVYHVWDVMERWRGGHRPLWRT